MSDYTRPPHREFDPVAQNLSTLCWFACYVMLFRWKKHIKQSKIEAHIKETLRDAGIDLETAGRQGLRLKDNKKAHMALGLGAYGYGQPVTLHNLRTRLKKSPVWATGQWMKGRNHVYLLMAVSEDWVEYYDPWWDTSKADALSLKKASLEWILYGDGKKNKGLAHTHSWFPLAGWK